MRNTANNAAVIALAGRFNDAFRIEKRGNGKDFWTYDGDHADAGAIQVLAMEAHGDMMPDDTRFEYIANALALISEQSESADLDELGDEIEPDAYTHDLLRWVSSHLSRVGYVDEVVAEYGWSKDGGLATALMLAQQREKQEVYNSVLSSLRELVEQGDLS